MVRLVAVLNFANTPSSWHWEMTVNMLLTDRFVLIVLFVETEKYYYLLKKIYSVKKICNSFSL